MNTGVADICVLYVDDETGRRDTVASSIEKEDDRITVRTAASPAEAREILSAQEVDCVVSEYDLTRTNGFEFLRAVREEQPDLPFVLYTDGSTEKVAAAAVSAGAADHLSAESETQQWTRLADRVVDAAERHQFEREERFRELAETIQEVIWMSDPARDDLFYVHPAYEDIWAEPTDSLSEDRSTFLDAVHPEDRDRVAAALDAAASGEYDEEYRIARPDGEQRWIHDRAVPVRDEAGEIRRVVGIASDITDRKEREQNYELTVDFLQELYDVATDAETDTREKITRLLQVGSEKLDLPPGYLTRIETDPDEPTEGTQRVIKASGDHELLQPGNSCPLSQSYCRKTIQMDGLSEVYDAVAAGWEGDPAYELFNLGCYIGSRVTVDDELYGTVFFASEAPCERAFSGAERTFVRLTSQLVSYELERDRATSELQSQNERLSQFANIVSHDLRNPLNVAQARLELVQREREGDNLEAIDRALGRMDALITDLLTLAREGETAIDVSTVELANLTEEAWQTVDTAGATLGVTTDRAIRADGSHLRQLVENLIHNSVEHGGSDVTVTVGDLDAGFYVADDGPGIPEAQRTDVFEAGYSTGDQGTGYELAIVERVANVHDWTVSVTDSDDGGARFEISGVEFAGE